MSLLTARNGDENSHGGGNIITTTSTTFAESILVSKLNDPAKPDKLCSNNVHCNPKTSSSSTTVFVEGLGSHRIGDSRVCGATTINSTGNSTVYIG
jgi:uncharacterized Zn-binding protein involved in type VI secretion